ncbi:MAG: hypothetical protein MZV64_34375 [Ignavibacteriales bacterium]|nr:hypothetical protein [Ignavibacteriales bacterium]
MPEACPGTQLPENRRRRLESVCAPVASASWSLIPTELSSSRPRYMLPRPLGPGWLAWNFSISAFCCSAGRSFRRCISSNASVMGHSGRIHHSQTRLLFSRPRGRRRS